MAWFVLFGSTLMDEEADPILVDDEPGVYEAETHADAVANAASDFPNVVKWGAVELSPENVRYFSVMTNPVVVEVGDA